MEVVATEGAVDASPDGVAASTGVFPRLECLEEDGTGTSLLLFAVGVVAVVVVSLMLALSDGLQTPASVLWEHPISPR